MRPELAREANGFVDAIGHGLLSDTLAQRLKVAEAELKRLQARNGQVRTAIVGPSIATVGQRVATMRENLSKGGELARGVIATLFPNGIWLQPDPSGVYLWAVFADGVAAALFDQEEIAESFPISQSRRKW